LAVICPNTSAPFAVGVVIAFSSAKFDGPRRAPASA
jgi:hypothetical protein